MKNYLENRCSSTKLDKVEVAFIEMYPKTQTQYAAIPYQRPLTRHAAAYCCTMDSLIMEKM